MFGVEPFTDEDIVDFKAMLFEIGQAKDCINGAAYTKYMSAYLNKNLYEEVTKAERLVEQDAIDLLTEKGYKVIKNSFGRLVVTESKDRPLQNEVRL